MGCDGGTIPKRNEIVKNKQKHQERDKNADLSAKWQFCALSGLRLKKPIVACQLGRLYNKDSIIEYLLEPKQSASSSSSNQSATASAAAHIKSLRDVKELKLKEKVDFNKGHQASSGNEQFKAQFVCPISGLDLNGKYKFYYMIRCGCVVSERALKEVPNEKLCLLCTKSYDPKMDLIVLNGDAAETSELKKLLLERRRQNKSAKRDQSSQLAMSAKITSSTRSSSSKDTHVRQKHDETRHERLKRHKRDEKPNEPIYVLKV